MNKLVYMKTQIGKYWNRYFMNCIDYSIKTKIKIQIIASNKNKSQLKNKKIIKIILKKMS